LVWGREGEKSQEMESTRAQKAPKKPKGSQTGTIFFKRNRNALKTEWGLGEKKKKTATGKGGGGGASKIWEGASTERGDNQPRTSPVRKRIYNA